MGKGQVAISPHMEMVETGKHLHIFSTISYYAREFLIVNSSNILRVFLASTVLSEICKCSKYTVLAPREVIMPRERTRQNVEQKL